MNKLFLFFLTLFVFSFLLGCIGENTPVTPIFTLGQLFSKISEPDGSPASYSAFIAGDYNGLGCCKVNGADNNKLYLYDLNASGGSGSWLDLTDFPTGCGVGQAVQVVGASLTCVDINSFSGGFVDTNTQTAGWTNASGAYLQDLNMNGNNIKDVNVIWWDANKTMGVMGCADGNIITGYLVGYSC